MSSTDSPAVARRRVRLALKAAREAKQFTQTQVANAMEWSLSKVMRIEKGEVNVSPGDLRVLMDYLEIDPTQKSSLLDDARVSRLERRTVDAADREFLTPAMIELYQFEDESTSVLMYHNYFIPGRLQTRAYAEALIRPLRESAGDEVADARIEARLRRQETLRKPGGPTYLVILDESVLLRPVGGVAVLADQLDWMTRLSANSAVRLRIVPLSSEHNPLRFFGPFTLCDLGSTKNAFMYVETYENDEAVRDDARIERHRRAFEQAWGSVPDEARSQELIRLAMKKLPDGVA